MYNIAIDGPSGVGKSTLAKALAKRLGITYLDTGAMYRAMAWKALSLGIDPNDEERVKTFVDDVKIDVKYKDGVQQIFVDGIDVSLAIREHHMSKASSDISRHNCVRTKLVAMQREIASKQSVVLDGRDITSVVLPHAEYKFFLTAKAEVRAERRAKELEAKGNVVDFAKILKDIEERDYNDSHRANSPLTLTPDSVLVDSSNMTAAEVLEYILSFIKEE